MAELGDAFGVWVAQSVVWADGVHQVLLGIYAAFGTTLIVWHMMRSVYGAVTGNAKRALKEAAWQVGLVALGFEVVRNPEPIWRLSGGVVGGFYRLFTAPFGG